MKRFVSLILCLTLFTLAIYAQGFVPRESWPFLYEDFIYGTSSSGSSDKITESYFNISATDGKLYYLNSEKEMMIADMTLVNSVRVEADIYVNVMGKMYKLISTGEKGFLLQENIVDIEKMQKVNIGYGVSSASASYDKLGVLLHGRMSSFNKAFALSKGEKMAGPELPMQQTYYLNFNGNMVPATRSAVLGIPGIDKKAAKSFIKKEKIRWKNADSLKLLLDWLVDNI